MSFGLDLKAYPLSLSTICTAVAYEYDGDGGASWKKDLLENRRVLSRPQFP
jgi:hypothetical protein